MKKSQRMQAALICLGFVLLVVLTQVFSVHVLHHHCVGEDCVVCHQLQHNQQQLTHTANHGDSAVEFLRPGQEEALSHISGEQEEAQATLISLKVKLSN